MDDTTMRKRERSIQSSDEANEERNESDEKQQAENSAPLDAKKHLVNDFAVQEAGEADSNNNNTIEPPFKRQKTQATESANNSQEVEVAKKKLSKWAARLFDPNRPRGLVEAPRTIPLNDEFLTAFGKREKEFDDKMGRSINVNQEIVDDDDDDASVADDEKETVSSTKKLPMEGRKIKIVNLAFTTSQATLEAACQQYGPVEVTNLLMDKEKPNLNTGRAYVTFESPVSADACVDGLQALDGRPLRVSIALPETKRGRKSMDVARYWVKDISTKCFRCNQVGHVESQCPNAAIPKPCPLCGGFNHDMRSCPKSRVCFRCGVPGHINRECSYRQNLPKRVVCGICFQSGHHRCSCRRRATDAPSHDAKCFVCQGHGHFMCRQMKWFFGLEGVSCFNCGRNGHHGYDCDRPGVDACARDDALADREIERAEAMSLADELEQQSRKRGRDRNNRGYDGGGGRSRAKSQPPPRKQQQQQSNQRRPNGGQQGKRGYDMSGGRNRR